LGEEMDKTTPIDNWNIETSYVMSIDIGWSSSATAIMVSRWVNNKVQNSLFKGICRQTIIPRYHK
jgi:hypothetical protein